jgi:hypothetical protein
VATRVTFLCWVTFIVILIESDDGACDVREITSFQGFDTAPEPRSAVEPLSPLTERATVRETFEDAFAYVKLVTDSIRAWSLTWGMTTEVFDTGTSRVLSETGDQQVSFTTYCVVASSPTSGTWRESKIPRKSGIHDNLDRLRF